MTRARVVGALLVALLIAALVAWLLTWRALSHQRELARSGDQATAAARRAAAAMTTYGYKSLDHDFAWVNDAGTAKFRKYFADASAKTRPLITSLHASAKGKVVDAAPEVKDVDHVTVLLYVDQTLTAAGQSGSELDQPRITMSMVRQNGRWLVDKVELDKLVAK